ncbi:MAG: DUF58 domain-containing protein [Anaerolineales bacterium]|nr:DUF58 domain-containing protein [Anaerolineales bacterium]
MHFTLRAVLLFLLAAPLIAAGGGIPAAGAAAAVWLAAVAGLSAADFYWAGSGAQFGIRRSHDSKLSLGTENAVRLDLHNGSGRRIAFSIRDEFPPAFSGRPAVVSGECAGRSDWSGTYAVIPPRRGDYQFGDIHMRWAGPLGLVRRQSRFPSAGPVRVYPNLMDIRRYDLMLRQNRLREMGLRHSRIFGEGTEFERLREYLPDDDFRRIHWKATARRNRPVTIEYQTERSQNVVALLDTGRMMQSPVGPMAKLDYAVNAVLLLAFVAAGKGDKVGLLSFADDIQHYLRPQAGRRQFYRMLKALYAVEPQSVEPDYRRAASYLAGKERKRSLVILFTDLTGNFGVRALLEGMGALAGRSLPMVVTVGAPDIHQAAAARPADSESVYLRMEAEALLEERRQALDALRRKGVLTLDVPANHLSVAVINRYLELKGRRLL